jgi:myo-inositol-1-phosphate synthase
MGGRSTISITNICQDSLLATPLIIDLVLLAELFTRVSYVDEKGESQSLYSVLSLLSYMLSTFDRIPFFFFPQC